MSRLPERATSPWQADPSAAAAPRRLTTSFGPYRIGLQFEPGALSGDLTDWLEPPALAADLEVTLAVAPLPVSPRVFFSHLDANGYAFRTMRSRGTGDARTATAQVTLANPIEVRHRIGTLAEACMALAYSEVLRRGGILLHGATLWLDGRACVVVGFSGAGKSTLAARFPDAHLHDEHAWLLPLANGRWEVWRHAEFRGPRGDLPWRVPLAGLFVLGPDRSRTAATPVAEAERMASLLVHAFHAGGAGGPLMLRAVETLAAQVPVFALSHHLADPPARVAAVLQEACRAT